MRAKVRERADCLLLYGLTIAIWGVLGWTLYSKMP